MKLVDIFALEAYSVRKMKHVIILVLFLLVSVGAQLNDLDFSIGCFPSDDQTEYIKFICMKIIECSPQSMEKELVNNKSKVELIKYECDKQINSVTIHIDQLKLFTNLRVLDISQLGIERIIFDQGPVDLPPTDFKIQVEILNASHNQLESIYHSNEIVNHMPRVIELDFSYNHIQYLHFSRYDTTNNISIINCSHNHIEYIQDGTFSTIKKLEVLDLSHNDIKWIGENAFKSDPFNSDPKIRMLNLSDNPLDSFDFLILFKLCYLEALDLSNTHIKKIDERSFLNNFKIKFLNLGQTLLEEISSKSIAPLHDLEILDLSNNNFQKISDACFVNNPKMKQLNLKGTALKNFNFHMFSPETKLIDVQLPSNSIEKLDISCLNSNCHFKYFYEEDYFKNIQIFKASGNRGQNIPTLLEKIGTNVEIMDLSWNFIEALTESMFVRFFHLKYLYLSHSEISEIESNAFSKQSNLISLDLSNNNLKDFDNLVFSFRGTLERLNLADNQLTKLNKIVPNNLPKLKQLKIFNNSFGPLYVEDFSTKWSGYNVDIQNEFFDENVVRMDIPTTTKGTTDDFITTTTLTLPIIPDSISTTTLASPMTAITEANESQNTTPNLSTRPDILSIHFYSTIGISLIIIAIIIIPTIFCICRKKAVKVEYEEATIDPINSIGITKSAQSIELLTENPYEELIEPSAYAVTTLQHIPHYENAPAHTTTIDRYKDAHNYHNSLQPNEYATIYHHYATVSKPKSNTPIDKI